MLFTRIQTANFRNLEPSTIDVGKRQVVLVGVNGQGKTNFLEAIYTLCYGSSFRTQFLKELARNGERDFSLKAWFVDEEKMEHELSFYFKNAKRTILVDGKQIYDRKELMYTIPCIVFSHDDIWFVNGDPEQRRKFFDQTMSMYDPLFFDDLRHYKQILKQRNQAIKDNQVSLLSIYDLQLAKYGVRIQEERTKAVFEFNQFFTDLYREVSGTDWNLVIKYNPSWKRCSTEQEIVDLLSQTRERDFILQTTSSGIHRDRFIVMCGDVPFATQGSTGQIRLASLLFRIAQMRFFKNKTGRNPVILVDDVLLELDFTIRENFLKLIDGYDQAFFTFLPEEHYFKTLSETDVCMYDVRKGIFSRHEEL